MRLIRTFFTALNLSIYFSISLAIQKEWYIQGSRVTKMKYNNASVRLPTKATLSSKATVMKASRKGSHSSKAPGKGFHSSSKAPGKASRSSKAPGKASNAGKDKNIMPSKGGKNQTSTMVSMPKTPKYEEQDSSVKDTYQLNGAQSSLANGADKSDAYYSSSLISGYAMMIISCVVAFVL